MYNGTHKQQARKLNLRQPAYKRHGITNNTLQKDFRQYRIQLMNGYIIQQKIENELICRSGSP